MNPNIVHLISQYRDKGILIDTNLLLVFLVGNVEPRLVGRAASTNDYSCADYDQIRYVIGCFNRIITIPQVLTETGNMLKRNCSNNTRLDLSRELALFVHSSQTQEARILSKRITAHPAFNDLGYADAAILSSASGKHLLMTADEPLQSFASALGIDVLPFQWLRAM